MAISGGSFNLNPRVRLGFLSGFRTRSANEGHLECRLECRDSSLRGGEAIGETREILVVGGPEIADRLGEAG